MKFKSLFAIALTLTMIGLSFPAVAGEQDRQNSGQNSGYKQKPYYGKYYHHAKTDTGYDIYIHADGDYWKDGVYYPDTEENTFESYHDPNYKYKKVGDYYYGDRYVKPKKW